MLENSNRFSFGQFWESIPQVPNSKSRFHTRFEESTFKIKKPDGISSYALIWRIRYSIPKIKVDSTSSKTTHRRLELKGSKLRVIWKQQRTFLYVKLHPRIRAPSKFIGIEMAKSLICLLKTSNTIISKAAV